MRNPIVLPRTEERVPENTATNVNEAIRSKTLQRLKACADEPQKISGRLRALDQEWDTERTLEANASTLALIGLALGAFVSPWFLLLPAVVAAFLLQHALQGWCPPLPILRRLGFRTAREIEEERFALKLMRGDLRRAEYGPEAALAAASR